MATLGWDIYRERLQSVNAYDKYLNPHDFVRDATFSTISTLKAENPDPPTKSNKNGDEVGNKTKKSETGSGFPIRKKCKLTNSEAMYQSCFLPLLS